MREVAKNQLSKHILTVTGNGTRPMKGIKYVLDGGALLHRISWEKERYL